MKMYFLSMQFDGGWVLLLGSSSPSGDSGIQDPSILRLHPLKSLSLPAAKMGVKGIEGLGEDVEKPCLL